MPTRRIVDSWLKSITAYEFAPTELADRLLNLGIEVESIEDRTEVLRGFVVGEVLTCEKHPDADRLSVCTVRDADGEHTVVCGAPNVAAGQKIVFAPVGTVIPTAGFTIEKRKIRGIVSSGMICSESELGLSEDQSGIMVLPEESVVGTPLSTLMGDVIYEIEVTPNRADCLSHLGIAREVAAMTGESIFLPPTEIASGERATADAVRIDIDRPDLCPRYVARIVRGVKIGPSPAWLQEAIRKLGLRPRNNVVDITSYVLFECGHPLHAFDFDLLAGQRIVVKTARGGKAFVTLDGRQRELPADALMICDAEKPVAIAGVMGGENSEIHDQTVNVLIESAYFNPSSIRRTSRQLGLSTDASYRFERGADIDNTVYAVNRAASMIAEIAGGSVLDGVLDVYPEPRSATLIELRFARTNEVLGTRINAERQVELLARLGFEVDVENTERAMVGVPSYRVDVFGEIDLIEEIARLHGYDEIPDDTTATVAFDVRIDPLLELVDRTREFFVDNGFTELVTSQLTDPETAGAYGRAVELRNALGRDFSMMRTTLAPSLARVVALNQRYSRPDLRLFEVGKIFRRSDSPSTPIQGIVETLELGVAIAGGAEPMAWDVRERSSDIFDLRGMLSRYFERIGLPAVTFRRSDDALWGLGAPALSIHTGEEEIGRLAPLEAGLVSRLKIDGHPVAAIFDLERMAGLLDTSRRYVPPSKYPTVVRDVSVLVPAGVPVDALEATILGAGGVLLGSVRLFDLFQGRGVKPGHKSIAWSLGFASPERTLTDEEVDAAVGSITAALERQHGAQLRGASTGEGS